jgi:hypothetical protein
MSKKQKRNDGKNTPTIEKKEIVEKCKGCEKVTECGLCERFADPSFHWEEGQVCTFATHDKKKVTIVKKITNPQKASRRAANKRATKKFRG